MDASVVLALLLASVLAGAVAGGDIVQPMANLKLMGGEEGRGEDAPVSAGFGLPEELAVLLPAYPFKQLEVVCKITSIALASRVGRLQAEAAGLRVQLAQRDATAEDLRKRIELLESALALAIDRLSRAEDDKTLPVKQEEAIHLKNGESILRGEPCLNYVDEFSAHCVWGNTVRLYNNNACNLRKIINDKKKPDHNYV